MNLMKYFEAVERGPTTNQLHFGGDPTRIQSSCILIRIRTQTDFDKDLWSVGRGPRTKGLDSGGDSGQDQDSGFMKPDEVPDSEIFHCPVRLTSLSVGDFSIVKLVIPLLIGFWYVLGYLISPNNRT